MQISSGAGQPHTRQSSVNIPSWLQKLGWIADEQESNKVPSRQVRDDASGFTNAWVVGTQQMPESHGVVNSISSSPSLHDAWHDPPISMQGS